MPALSRLGSKLYSVAQPGRAKAKTGHAARLPQFWNKHSVKHQVRGVSWPDAPSPALQAEIS